MQGLSLVAASGGHSSSRCAGLSLSRPLLLRSTGSRRAGSVVVAHGPSCSKACGIFPYQGSNPCPLHRQADSQPLRHQGSPERYSYDKMMCKQNPEEVEGVGQADNWGEWKLPGVCLLQVELCHPLHPPPLPHKKKISCDLFGNRVFASVIKLR